MMKILVFGSNQPDYLQDDVYHGLKSLFGTDVESNVKLHYLYDDYADDVSKLYGRGISYAKNLKSELYKPAHDSIEKALSGYYDRIIYLNVRRCSEGLRVLAEAIPNRILMIDGEDDTLVPETNLLLFKRELLSKPSSRLRPISFAIPEEKIVRQPFPEKEQLLGRQIPGSASNRGYLFSTEEAYYRDYQISKYGITFKKAGWDCKRHYEILANRCVPLFEKIDQCPPYTMVNFPKKLVSEIEKNWMSASTTVYEQWLAELFEYTKHNLTTKSLAHYLLDF